MNRISRFSLRRLVQGLVLALLACCVLPLQAQSYVYWTWASGEGYIGRGTTDGVNVSSGPPDNQTNTINPNWITIARQRYDGEGNPIGQPTGQPYGIASDSQYIYYSDMGGYIGRVGLDGSGHDSFFVNLTEILDQNGLPSTDPGYTAASPRGIAVDGQYIYWADIMTGRIGRANKSDGFIPTGQGSWESFITGVSPTHVAVDGTYIYWSNINSIGRATLAGVLPNLSFATPTSPAVNLYGLALDGAGQIRFLASRAGAPWGTYIGSMSPAGTISATKLDILDSTWGIAIADRLYLSGGSSYRIYTEALGGSAAVSYPFSTANAYSIAVANLSGGPVTVVSLTSFTATPKPSQVDLAWTTGSEVNTAGFNLWRSATATGTFVKINPSLIPATGVSPAGASYTWADTSVVAGQTWYYKLEDIDASGIKTLHGPVSATVGAPLSILSFQATPPDVFQGGNSLLNWTVTGSPALSIVGLGPVSASSLWVSPSSTVSYLLTDGQGSQSMATVTVKPFGLLDMAGLSLAWGSVKGDATYNPCYDLNGDGKVDDLDVALCLKGL